MGNMLSPIRHSENCTLTRILQTPQCADFDDVPLQKVAEVGRVLLQVGQNEGVGRLFGHFSTTAQCAGTPIDRRRGRTWENGVKKIRNVPTFDAIHADTFFEEILF